MLDTILGCFLLVVVVVGYVLRYKFTFMNSSRIKYLKDSGTLFFAHRNFQPTFRLCESHSAVRPRELVDTMEES